MNPPQTKVTDSQRTDKGQLQGQKQDQATTAIATPKLPKEDWDQELMFPSHPLDWEQAVSEATAMEGNEADVVDDNQVKTWDNRAAAWAMPKTDTRGDNQEEALSEGGDVTIGGVEEFKALGDGTTTGALVEG